MLYSAQCAIRLRRFTPIVTLLALLPGGLIFAADAPRVVVDEARQIDIVRQIPLTGTITSARVSRLSPEVEGRVKRLFVDVGDDVAQGDRLLQVDSELAELTYEATQALTEQTRAELADAQRRYADAQRLRKQNTVSENELLLREAEVQIKSAALARQQAEQRRQQAELERYVVKAPFEGVISAKLTEAGEWIEPGTALFNLVATHELRADLAVPQGVYTRINEHSRIHLTLDALAEHSVPGRISAVVPVNDPSARTFLLRVLFDDAELRAIPGMSVAATLEAGSGDRGVVVARDAVLRYPDGRVTVWVVSQDGDQASVSERHVTLGHSFDGQVEVRDGLQAGDTVVVLGNEALQQGQAVRIEQARE